MVKSTPPGWQKKAKVLFRWTHSQFYWVMQTTCHQFPNCHGNTSRMYVKWLWIYLSHVIVWLEDGCVYGNSKWRQKESQKREEIHRSPLKPFLGVHQYCLRRCHGEFGTPDLWHPRAKYPREIGTPKQNTLREFGTPLCTPWGIWHPVTVQLNVCQRIKARHCWTSSGLIRMCESWKMYVKKLTMRY